MGLTHKATTGFGKSLVKIEITDTPRQPCDLLEDSFHSKTKNIAMFQQTDSNMSRFAIEPSVILAAKARKMGEEGKIEERSARRLLQWSRKGKSSSK